MSELERARAWLAAAVLIAVMLFVAVPDSLHWPLFGAALTIGAVTWLLIRFNLAKTTHDYPYE